MCQCNSTVQDPHTLCSSVSHLTPLGWGGSSHHFHTSFSSSFFLRPPFAGDWIDYIIMTSLIHTTMSNVTTYRLFLLGLCFSPALLLIRSSCTHTHTHTHKRKKKNKYTSKPRIISARLALHNTCALPLLILAWRRSLFDLLGLWAKTQIKLNAYTI